jgi:hypothetical protein
MKTLVLRNNGNPSRVRVRVKSTRWHATFLKALSRNPNVALACRAAGINRTTAYRHREDIEAFALKWQEVLDASVDRVEAKAFELAYDGNERLIEFILKAYRPERFRERTELGVAGGIVLIPCKSEGAE